MMKKYAKIENGKIIQTQPNQQKGFVEVDDDVVCGQIKQGGGFVNPPPEPDARSNKEKRQDETPDIDDQLDALWDIVDQMKTDGFVLPKDSDKMLDEILAIKKKFPK